MVVPSRRGDVRLTPLFLHREQLDNALSAAQDLVAQHVRLSDVRCSRWPLNGTTAGPTAPGNLLLVFIHTASGLQRHFKYLAGQSRRPVIVAHSLQDYVRACGHCNNRPAGLHSDCRRTARASKSY